MNVSPINFATSLSNSKKVKQNKQVAFAGKSFNLVKYIDLHTTEPQELIRLFGQLMDECKPSSGVSQKKQKFLVNDAFEYLKQLYKRSGLYGTLASLGKAYSSDLQIIREKGEHDYDDIVLAQTKDEELAFVLEDEGPYNLWSALFNFSRCRREIVLSFKNEDDKISYSLDKKNRYKIKVNDIEQMIVNPTTFEIKSIGSATKGDLYLPPGV